MQSGKDNLHQTDSAMKAAFEKIYNENIWGMGSGVGSLPDFNLEYMNFLQHFMLNNEIKKVMDFGCGDWQFSKHINWDNVDYLGIDVVESVIESNLLQFKRPGINFAVLHEIDEFSTVDLIVCKDVFQHLPIEKIRYYLSEFKKAAKFILVTNDIYPDRWLNVEIEPGAGRAIRLDRDPFDEKCAAVLVYDMYMFEQYYKKMTVLIYGDQNGQVSEQ